MHFITIVENIEAEFSVDVLNVVTVTGNCVPTGTPLQTGTMAEGESQSCNIVNSIDITSQAG
jgi:hypothetical protein